MAKALPQDPAEAITPRPREPEAEATDQPKRPARRHTGAVTPNTCWLSSMVELSLMVEPNPLVSWGSFNGGGYQNASRYPASFKASQTVLWTSLSSSLVKPWSYTCEAFLGPSQPPTS